MLELDDVLELEWTEPALCELELELDDELNDERLELELLELGLLELELDELELWLGPSMEGAPVGGAEAGRNTGTSGLARTSREYGGGGGSIFGKNGSSLKKPDGPRPAL